MNSREEIAEAIRAQFDSVKERGRVLGQALKARADIAATRRRLRMAMADLGEEVYERMVEQASGPWAGDADMADHRVRIDGIRAELRQRERALTDIMKPPEETAEALDTEPPAAAAGTPGDDES